VQTEPLIEQPVLQLQRDTELTELALAAAIEAARTDIGTHHAVLCARSPRIVALFGGE
jgi:hypothetical protein